MYSTFGNVKSALKLAWKYKILWIFSLVLGITTWSSYVEFSDFKEKLPPEMKPTQNGELYQMSYIISSLTTDTNYKMTNVLGTSSKRNEENFLSQLGEVNLVVPAILISFSLLIFVIYKLGVTYLLSGWSRAGLVAGTFKAVSSDEKLSLNTLGKIAGSNMIKIIKLNVLAILYLFLITILAVVLPILTFTLLSSGVALKIVLTVIIIIGALISATSISAGLVFSYRHILHTDTKTKNALSFGIKTFYKNFGKSIKLFVLNIVLIIAGFIIFTLIAGTVMGLFSSPDIMRGFSILLIIPLALLSPILIIAVILLGQTYKGYVKSYLELTFTNLYLYTQNIEDAKTIKFVGEEDGN